MQNQLIAMAPCNFATFVKQGTTGLSGMPMMHSLPTSMSLVTAAVQLNLHAMFCFFDIK